MGNSNTKETRPSDGTDAAGRSRPGDGSGSSRDARARNRMSRTGELSLFGITHGSSARDRPDAPYERRETKQEREARRLERERVARLKEREQSLREEHVDGGYLVTLGTYIGPEDFSKSIVRQLQIERKLAPFWRGLNDWSDNWAEHQLIAAARGLPIPAADAIPDPDLIARPPPPAEPSTSPPNIQNLTVPMGPRTLSVASDRSVSAAGSSLPSPTTVAPGSNKTSSFKPRSKALAAALSIGSRNSSTSELGPREIQLPHDPFVNGQPIEVFLYKDAEECPICFLSYPPYLNYTRCCGQPICSECFVQIKRADPHLPEHHPNGDARDPNEGLTPQDPPEMLISEPSCCPYCQAPEFGVTYEPPPFRRGLAYSNNSHPAFHTAMSSQSSIHSTLASPAPPTGGRRRTQSLSATAPNVITTDRVRPDWSTKLQSARAHQARRAAAATALHTAAFLMAGNEQRSILRPRFSRRSTVNNEPPPGAPVEPAPAGEPSSATQNPDGRRSRMEELEDMMFMEAVRLSLAAEEERKRKEEKAIRKETKRREKEQRKALKKQGGGPYQEGASGGSRSSLSLGLGRKRGNSTSSNLRMDATVQSASKAVGDDSRGEAAADATIGKGKAVERPVPESSSGESSFSGTLPLPISGSSSRGGSHLRQMSNASSLGSSLGDTPAGSFNAGGFMGPDGCDQAGGAGTAGRSDDADRDGSEPLFNFRSLAEMVGVNIEDGTAHAQWDGDNDGESPGASGATRPLSQVKEDDKEDAEAQHVENAAPAVYKVAATTTAPLVTAASAEQASSQQSSVLATPEVMITPETPLPDDDADTSKQLGNPKVMEHPAQTS
ncbi:hypothetical protein B0I35DRAFT_412657 [Stachybotrys elegans]|uniref:Protein sip5 n=1 Tax=Stachybotrys elegans TaxID=80388 RepID=A0A8K0SJH1_9HYPO|nr:hypothetical protein B0I35DRAFT_412657 [Stachybotrys elegans]